MIDLKPSKDYEGTDEWGLRHIKKKSISRIFILAEDLNYAILLAKLVEKGFIGFELSNSYPRLRDEFGYFSSGKAQKKIALVSPQPVVLACAPVWDYRPDMIYIYRRGGLHRLDKLTDRILREGNNLFKLYIAGEFDE